MKLRMFSIRKTRSMEGAEKAERGGEEEEKSAWR
jgi:hypothetical protein